MADAAWLPAGVADVSIERLSPQDFLKAVLNEIEELDDQQRERLLTASGTTRGRLDALQATLEAIAGDA